MVMKGLPTPWNMMHVGRKYWKRELLLPINIAILILVLALFFKDKNCLISKIKYISYQQFYDYPLPAGTSTLCLV